MTVCGNTQKLFVSFAGVLGISSVLYWGIPENSWLSVFKYVNIMGFLHTGDMMAVYRNIGLYGFPVSYITVSIVVCVIAGALLLAATVLIFSEQKITSRAGHRILPKGERFAVIVYFTGKQKRYCIINICFCLSQDLRF